MHFSLSQKFRHNKSAPLPRHPYSNMHTYPPWKPPSPPGSAKDKHPSSSEEFVTEASPSSPTPSFVSLAQPAQVLAGTHLEPSEPHHAMVVATLPLSPKYPSPIKVERESCYDSKRVHRERERERRGDDRLRHMIDQLRDRNCILQQELNEVREEVKNERAEKELHASQRQVLREQMEKLQARNESLNKSLSALQERQQQWDVNLGDWDRRMDSMKKSYEKVHSDLVAERARRQQLEEHNRRQEVSYSAVRESVKGLKMRYNRELQSVRALVEKIQGEFANARPSAAVELHKKQQQEERRRIKAAAKELEEMQHRYFDGIADLQAAILKQVDDANADIVSKLNEVHRAAKLLGTGG